MSRRGHSGDILSQQLSHGVLIPGHGIPLRLQKITHWRDVITRLQQAKGLQPAWHFSPTILSVVKTRRFTSQTLPLARRQTGVILHKFLKLRPLECLFLFSLSNDAEQDGVAEHVSWQQFGGEWPIKVRPGHRAFAEKHA